VAGNDKDFIVKNDLQVKGSGVSLFDSGDVVVGGDLRVKADSSVDFLTIDSDGVTLASPGIFTGDGSGLTGITADITGASVFDLSNVDSSGVTPIQNYVLAFDSATQKFIPSAAVAVLEIENDSDVLQAVRTVVDLGDISDVDSNASISGAGADPQEGQSLVWDNTLQKWKAGSASATATATVDSVGARNTSPLSGELFYDLDQEGLYVYDGNDWELAAPQLSSFEFIQPGTFNSFLSTTTYTPSTTIYLQNLKAVTRDSHQGITFSIVKNGTNLTPSFSIPAGQLRSSAEFSSPVTITGTDSVGLVGSVTSGDATILAVEVFFK